MTLNDKAIQLLKRIIKFTKVTYKLNVGTWYTTLILLDAHVPCNQATKLISTPAIVDGCHTYAFRFHCRLGFCMSELYNELKKKNKNLN